MCVASIFEVWALGTYFLPDMFLHCHKHSFTAAAKRCFLFTNFNPPAPTHTRSIYIYIYCAAIFSSNNTCSNILQNCVSILNVFSRLHWTWTLKRSALKSLFPCSWLKTFSAQRQFCNMQMKNAEAKTCSKWRAEGGTCTMCTAIIVRWWKSPLKSTTTHDLRTSAFNLYILLICWWYTIFLILKSIGYIAPRHEAVTQSCNAQFKVFIFTATVIVSAIECCATVCGTHTCTEPPKIQKGQTICCSLLPKPFTKHVLKLLG